MSFPPVKSTLQVDVTILNAYKIWALLLKREAIFKSPKTHASMQVLIPSSGLVLRCYFLNKLWFWWPSTCSFRSRHSHHWLSLSKGTGAVWLVLNFNDWANWWSGGLRFESAAEAHTPLSSASVHCSLPGKDCVAFSVSTAQIPGNVS